MTVTIEIMPVTPALAEEWLGKNIHNRTINHQIVSRYAQAMAAGDWPVTGDPIRFSTEGILHDGQHRLHAVIQAGVTVEMAVARGLDPRCQEYIDIGRKRTFADMLKLRGEKNATLLAGAIVWVMRLRSAVPSRNIAISPQEGFAVLDANPGLRDMASLCYPITKTHSLMYPSLAWALAYELTSIDQIDGAVFFERLGSGAGMEEDDPILRLRNWQIENYSNVRTGRMVAPWLHAAMAIKAWNAYRDGARIRMLRFRQGGAHPEEFPRPR